MYVYSALHALPWVTEVGELDVLNVVAWCTKYSTISCRGLVVPELPEKDISNVMVHCR